MEKLGKIKTKKLYTRCLNLARRKPAEFFSFRKMRGTHGYCNWTDLEFNPAGELLSTAYHECIHYLEPDWSETQVMYAESRVRNLSSHLEHALFLKHISMKLYKSELQKHILNRPKKKKKKLATTKKK
jgi:hypothetical protein